jgi:formylglycine-generating enzyme required for sulfatase activity
MRLMMPAALAATAAALAIASGPNLQHPADTTVPPVEIVTIAPGSFDFRLPGEYLEAERPTDAPKRATTFRRAFEIMRYQVSVADYADCVAEKACEAPEGGRTASSDLPVTGVSYRDATAYAAWLSARTGETWRLPSDAEWAFAAAERVRDEALDLPQDPENPAARWLARYRSEAGAATRDAEPKPLGYFGPNSKGLEDVAGNVWEWTTTCYLRAIVARDGRIAHRTENCGVRVVAGRHRGYMSTFIRDGRSGGCAAGLAPDNLGFRLVREKPSLVSYMRGLWGRAAE